VDATRGLRGRGKGGRRKRTIKTCFFLRSEELLSVNDGKVGKMAKYGVGEGGKKF